MTKQVRQFQAARIEIIKALPGSSLGMSLHGRPLPGETLKVYVTLQGFCTAHPDSGRAWWRKDFLIPFDCAVIRENLGYQRPPKAKFILK